MIITIFTLTGVSLFIIGKALCGCVKQKTLSYEKEIVEQSESDDSTEDEKTEDTGTTEDTKETQNTILEKEEDFSDLPPLIPVEELDLRAKIE
jgi:hypothetical protein